MNNIFEKAAEVLSERGHCKGSLSHTDGHGTTSYCAIGALYEATGEHAHNNSLTSEAANKAGALVVERFGVTVPDGAILHPLAYWNDLPETSAEDVILLFKELAHGEG